MDVELFWHYIAKVQVFLHYFMCIHIIYIFVINLTDMIKRNYVDICSQIYLFEST